jgi:hypothetical protein
MTARKTRRCHRPGMTSAFASATRPLLQEVFTSIVREWQPPVKVAAVAAAPLDGEGRRRDAPRR